MVSKKDRAVAYIKEFINRGYNINWISQPESELLKVYVFDTANKIIAVQGPASIVLDLKTTVQGGVGN